MTTTNLPGSVPAASRSPEEWVRTAGGPVLFSLVTGKSMATCVGAPSLHEWPLLNESQIARQLGLNPEQAARLLAALELGRRATVGIPWWLDNVNCPRHAAKALWPHMAQAPHEEMWVLVLTSMGKPLGVERVSQGGRGGLTTDVGTVLRAVLAHPLASALILAHNHPTSMAFPSPADEGFTTKLAQACAQVDLALWDHVVFAHAEEWWSMAEHGTLPASPWAPAPPTPKKARRAKKEQP